MNSERKRMTVDKRTKKTRLRWTNTGRANHLWDCEAMQVITAQMIGILPLSVSPEVETEPEEK